jgi:hypothetical protein
MQANDTDRILRAVWLKAADQPEGLELECGTYSSAKHYQMRLYKLVRPLRDAPSSDPELAAAAAKLSISVKRNDSKLYIQPVATAGVLGMLAQQIGFDPRREVASEAEGIEQALVKRLAGAELAPKSNPYNTRD